MSMNDISVGDTCEHFTQLNLLPPPGSTLAQVKCYLIKEIIMAVKTKSFTEDKIRELWTKGKSVTIDGMTYRVGKMSYGDYFLEPGKDMGEKFPFNHGTIWLRRSGKDKNIFVIEDEF